MENGVEDTREWHGQGEERDAQTVLDIGRDCARRWWSLIAGRLPARGIECDSTDLDYAMIGGSRINEYIIKVAVRLAQDADGELKAVASDVASSRKVSCQMDDVGGYTYMPPDGPTQINIELLPPGGIATEPAVFVTGVLLVSHE